VKKITVFVLAVSWASFPAVAAPVCQQNLPMALKMVVTHKDKKCAADALKFLGATIDTQETTLAQGIRSVFQDVEEGRSPTVSEEVQDYMAAGAAKKHEAISTPPPAPPTPAPRPSAGPAVCKKNLGMALKMVITAGDKKCAAAALQFLGPVIDKEDVDLASDMRKIFQDVVAGGHPHVSEEVQLYMDGGAGSRSVAQNTPNVPQAVASGTPNFSTWVKDMKTKKCVVDGVTASMVLMLEIDPKTRKPLPSAVQCAKNVERLLTLSHAPAAGSPDAEFLRKYDILAHVPLPGQREEAAHLHMENLVNTLAEDVQAGNVQTKEHREHVLGLMYRLKHGGWDKPVASLHEHHDQAHEHAGEASAPEPDASGFQKMLQDQKKRLKKVDRPNNSNFTLALQQRAAQIRRTPGA